MSLGSVDLDEKGVQVDEAGIRLEAEGDTNLEAVDRGTNSYQ